MSTVYLFLSSKPWQITKLLPDVRLVLNKGTEEWNGQKVAIVTGSSSGIGYAASLMLARNGFYTYASVRNIDKSASLESIANAERLPLKLIQIDVTDDSSVKQQLKRLF